LIRRSGGAPRRRRRRFSLNGLAIQLSAFALSFTLVALLVVTGSQAAFVEENQSVTDYVPIGVPADDDDGDAAPRRPTPTTSPTAPPTTSPTTSPTPAPSPTPTTAPASPTPEEPGEEPAEVPVEAVALTDSDAGSAMFSDGMALLPGVPLDRCIEVTYEGSADVQPVLLYAAAVSGDLAPYLDLTIEIGVADSGSFGTCDAFEPAGTVYDGTMADFAAAHADYGTGLTAWRPSGERDARSFRFSVAVRDEPEAAGRSVSFGFTWEGRGD
jgi:hypothetical protein